ncbi:Na+/H+ antiporter subunit A [Pseudactinotalea sp. HY158]|uniref:Na+/H+ antiporter subunit A n=1 Tax=Pseudactinotalea sp. HY158 TaxID=2654547 RepID=UPI00129C31FF|nr:Na+/H+ antiporter subunit A [Pseudactinotalea sp. HY158]QGH70692.1 Na+/H+ antiporter subunit A [Pseudactinotalea sp. HY158]
MLQLLIAHLVAALVAPWLMGRLGRKGFLVLALVPGSVAIWALANTARVLDGRGPAVQVEWVSSLGMNLDFRLDVLSWLMMLLVGGIGFFVLAYCAWYFASGAKALGRFAAIFVAFAGTMLGLVTTDNTIVLYVFWELTTVFSYLLVGHYFERKGSRRAAMQAIIVTTFGGLAMLAGIAILGEAEGGSYSISELVANPVDSPLVPVALACLLLGALSKSAQVPFHFWLPSAMAAPTPVSAYLHAAAMVKAGVYLVARFAPGYADDPVWRWLVLGLGATTLIIGGYRALRQDDLKLLLAFGTVSQLGFLILLVGQGDRAVALAGLALIGAHAMFKAALFLTVGAIDAAAGTRDVRELSGLARRLPWATIPGVLAVCSMVGLPPTAGYVAKEAVLEALAGTADPAGIVLLVAVVVGSVLTFAYGMRFLWGAFAAKPGIAPTPLTPEAPGLFVSPNVLAVAGLVAGLLPGLGERLLGPYAATYAAGEPGHLTLWGGFGLPLALTAVVIGVGTALAAGRRHVERAQGAVAGGPDADLTYRGLMRRLDRVAVTITARTQRGSLPLYLALILITTVALAAGTLLAGGVRPDEVRPWDNLPQAVIVVVIAIGAILTARSRRRLKAAVLLGITGYGVVSLFALHGAPDLALTQALVETVTLVVFILVLRRLPPYFSHRWLRGDRWWRVLVAVSVALLVMYLALTVPAFRIAEPISTAFPDVTLDFGYGRNIVNVTLVDTRAWDTMGEISVLLVAATGVASLVFIRSRSGHVDRARDLAEARPDAAAARDPRGVYWRTPPGELRAGRGRRWLAGPQGMTPYRRSVILEVTTRFVFHTMLVFSLFLLFSGHNAPGGGFAGGIVAGIALTLRYLAGGRYELGEAAPVLPGALLGGGLFLSVGAGIVPMFFGGQMLQSFKLDLTAPIFGDIHLVSTLVFDVGVYLVVVGLVLDILRSLGAEVDRHGEAAGQSAPEIPHDSPRVTADDARPPAVAASSAPPAAPPSAPPSAPGGDAT